MSQQNEQNKTKPVQRLFFGQNNQINHNFNWKNQTLKVLFMYSMQNKLNKFKLTIFYVIKSNI